MEAGLSKRFWAEAVNTMVYLKNRSPTVAVKDMTPEGAWSRRKVDVTHLHFLDAVFSFACLTNRERSVIQQTES
jgi:hypothetical protein